MHVHETRIFRGRQCHSAELTLYCCLLVTDVVQDKRILIRGVETRGQGRGQGHGLEQGDNVHERHIQYTHIVWLGIETLYMNTFLCILTLNH